MSRGKKVRVGASDRVGQNASDLEEIERRVFPCRLTITNNTAMPLAFAEVRLYLHGNARVLGPTGPVSDVVTFKSADQFIRFESDVEELAKLHGWPEGAITIEDEAATEDAPPAADPAAPAGVAPAAVVAPVDLQKTDDAS